MVISYIIIFLLILIIILLSLSLLIFLRKNTYISDKEKEFLLFVISIYKEYSADLGIQSKEEHEKLVKELEKIKNKHLKFK